MAFIRCGPSLISSFTMCPFLRRRYGYDPHRRLSGEYQIEAVKKPLEEMGKSFDVGAFDRAFDKVTAILFKKPKNPIQVPNRFTEGVDTYYSVEDYNDQAKDLSQAVEDLIQEYDKLIESSNK